MTQKLTIESVHDDGFETFTRSLADLSTRSGQDVWPQQQLELCAQYGVFRWFISEEFGGLGWNDQQIVQGYIKLAASCLTTTFVITQRTGACKRLAASENKELARRLLPALANGDTFATLGISHLTTSSRHLDNPILLATEVQDGWMLRGKSPWVTGAQAAEHIVVGSEVDGGGQILLAVPTDLPGIQIGTPNKLVALTGSKTGQVSFESVVVPHEFVLSGPKENVLMSGAHKSTGGLQTSALAIGLGSAAVDYLNQEAAKPNRTELLVNANALNQQFEDLCDRIMAMAAGEPVSTSEELRTDANSFALRASQAALVAAKGAGFVAGHPVGRWCREALFFLVWSCPQVVRDANLCELAGIAE